MELPSVRVMVRYGRDVHRLAAERVGDKDVPPLDQRNSIAEMADVIDDEAFNHGARR